MKENKTSNCIQTAVITMSDKGARGERKDTSGQAIIEILAENHWEIGYTTIIPDEQTQIEETLKYCADVLQIPLIVTTGGTGFSKRDVTPEATKAVIEREAPGIAEAMRTESLKITPMAMLSRATAGIRGNSLIVNLPGSEKAVRECLGFIVKPIRHGVEILLGSASECGQPVQK